jgi:hypothetical protein
MGLRPARLKCSLMEFSMNIHGLQENFKMLCFVFKDTRITI